jgi:hypothetical protein
MKVPLKTTRSSGTSRTEQRWLKRRSGSCSRRLPPCPGPDPASRPAFCAVRMRPAHHNVRVYAPEYDWQEGVQIEEMSTDKENASKQMQSLRTDTAHMRLKQQQIDKEASKEMPVNKVRACWRVVHACGA